MKSTVYEPQQHAGLLTITINSSVSVFLQAAALGQGSLCNQAIMLITDGAMEDFQDVFEEFNWPQRRVTNANASPCEIYSTINCFTAPPGPSIHLSDRSRDDVCRQYEMDRLQQQG